MINKLILGAAQFGMNYGINNSHGKMNQSQVFDILSYCNDKKIRSIDTANCYGDSEKIIGKYIKEFPDQKFFISTKISYKGKSLNEQISISLENLNCKKINVLLFHSYDLYVFFKPLIYDFCKKYKGKLFDRIGVSIYTNEEIKYLLDDVFIDIIQSPFNLFDNINHRGEIFEKIKVKGKKLQIRSVFLQGFFFKKINTLPKGLSPLTEDLHKLNDISKEFGISINSLALSYAFSMNCVDNIIIGVDSLLQLKKNIKDIKTELPQDIISKIESISIKDKRLLNPSLWAKL